MANLHKFIVSNKVTGNIEVAGSLYTAGDEIYLPEHQANHYSKSSYLINGLLEYVGEVEVSDTVMTEEFMTLYDAKLGPKKNILPVMAIKLATNLVKAVDPFAVVGADSAGGFIASRRMYLDKIGVKYMVGTSVAGAAVRPPWFLVTAGTPSLVSPSVLTAYDYSAGIYTAATNGSIAAAAPITWAANDMLIVGYTEKFASVMFDMGTASSASTTVRAFYWTASGWKEFLDEDGNATLFDYTAEVAGKTLSRVAPSGDKTRMVWWVKPDDWITGGPIGSGISNSDYCVGIQVSGALTALATCSVYPVTDRPLTHVNLGSYDYGVEHVYTYKSSTWSYGFDINGWGSAGDVIVLSTENKWTSLFIDMSANVNDVATGLAYAYWNGVEWVSLTCTDGTAAPAGTPFAQDGWITITSPIPTDWKKCVGTDIDPNLAGVGELYWFRISRSSGGPTKAATAATSVENHVIAANVWHYFNIKDDGFVDAGEPINFICAFEEGTVDKIEIMAIGSDI